jgi:hypothetical protein
MRTRSHRIGATALVVAAIAAPAASAMPIDPTAAGGQQADPRQVDMHASTVTGPSGAGIADARGEHAAAVGQPGAAPAGRVADLRTPDAVEPFARPVVVEVDAPAGPGFDWVAAIIGVAGGLAVAVLAVVAVSGGRRRGTRAHVA